MARRVLYILLALLIATSFACALAEEQFVQIGQIPKEACSLSPKTYPTSIRLKVATNIFGMGTGANKNNIVPFDVYYTGFDNDFNIALVATDTDILKYYIDQTTQQSYLVAQMPGKTVIQVVVVDQYGRATNIRSNKVKITVKKRIPVTNVKLDSKSLLMYTSDGSFDLGSLLMTVKPLNADDVMTDGRIPLSWTINKPNIARIDNNMLTGIETGKAVLTGRGSGKSVKLTLNVVNNGTPGGPTTAPTTAPTPTPTPSTAPTATPTSAPTPTPASSAQWRIFVFANADYDPNSGGSDLAACGNDAIMMNKTYSFASWNGANNMTGYLLKDKTGQQMYDLMRQMSTIGIDSDDVTIFYYTGHGAYSSTPSQVGALVGTDGVCVTHDLVMKCLDAVPGKVIMLIDACYSGVYAKETNKAVFTAKGGDPAAFNNSFINAVKRHSQSKALSNKYSVLTASSASQVSMCRLFGFFTQALCEGMGGVYDGDSSIIKANMKADTNQDGRVSLYEGYVYAKAGVNAYLRGSGDSQDVQVWPANSTFAIYERS